MVKAYAQAIAALIGRGMKEEEAFTKLRAHLAASGRLKLLPQLLRELKAIEARSRTSSPVLEAATAKDAEDGQAEARSRGVAAETRINPELVSGWRLTADGTVIDRSGKRALIDLYRRITA